MEKNDNTALSRMRHVDDALDQYEKSIGLPEFSEDASNDDVKKYLEMTREQMELLSIEDCAQAALMLSGYCFYLQRCYNREISRINWAKGVLSKQISGREAQYKGSWDSQYHQAINNDDFAKKVLTLKNYAQQRADRLTFLATSVRNISDLLVNLQRAKAMK